MAAVNRRENLRLVACGMALSVIGGLDGRAFVDQLFADS